MYVYIYVYRHTNVVYTYIKKYMTIKQRKIISKQSNSNHKTDQRKSKCYSELESEADTVSESNFQFKQKNFQAGGMQQTN